MMRIRTVAPLTFAALALAACGSNEPSVSATNASVGDVANKVAAATGGTSFVSPGHWQGTMTITDMTMPGMPPAIAGRMKAEMAKAKSFESCLTKEEAAQPKGKFFGSDNKQCKYDHFTMAGGAIDAVMTCAHGPMQQTMTMKGNYSADSYNMSVATVAKGAPAGGPGNMTMAMTVDAKRTGECTGKEPG